MPRYRRVSPTGYAQHVLNRANDRKLLFPQVDDYLGFLSLMRIAAEQHPIDLFNYALMPTHFHFVVRANEEGALSEYMRMLLGAHVKQHHRRHGTMGRGHLYQGRFKNFIIADDRHLLTVMRYVEANPLRAGLVRRAEDWPWSSASPHARRHLHRPALADWPVVRPAGWLDFVNGVIDEEELERVRTSLIRGRPLADPEWQIPGPLADDLRHTLNPTHRPARRHVKIESVSVPVPEAVRLWEEV